MKLILTFLLIFTSTLSFCQKTKKDSLEFLDFSRKMDSLKPQFQAYEKNKKEYIENLDNIESLKKAHQFQSNGQLMEAFYIFDALVEKNPDMDGLPIKLATVYKKVCNDKKYSNSLNQFFSEKKITQSAYESKIVKYFPEIEKRELEKEIDKKEYIALDLQYFATNFDF